MQLVKAIVHQARRSQQDPAIAFGAGVASFGSLMGSTAAAVEVLRTLGVARGSLVVLDIRNPIHHTAMIYALALLGIRSASVGTVQVTRSGPRPDLFLTDRDDLARRQVCRRARSSRAGSPSTRRHRSTIRRLPPCAAFPILTTWCATSIHPARPASPNAWR